MKASLKVGTAHFLTVFEQPAKNIKSVTDVILFRKVDGRMVPDAHHSDMMVCPLTLGLHDKALILKVAILYTHNETARPFSCTLGPMFDPDESVEDADTLHPDHTGVIKFILPGRRWHGIIEPTASVIYEPNLTNLSINILQYAGLESHILEARSTTVGVHGTSNDYTLFNVTDPLFVFLMAHKNHFPELTSDEIKKRTDTIYSVSKVLVKRVQQFFRNAIFPLLHYTKMKKLQFTCNFEAHEELPDLLMAQISVDYMIVSPQNFAYKTHDIKLTF